MFPKRGSMMQVLEIKNNLVKIAYDVNDNLALSSFVIIEGTNTPYVAQVVNVKADKLTNFAIVKLLFTFNEEGILKNYNGTIPSLKSTVSILPSKELLDIIPIENNLIMGELAQQGVTLNVDKTILDNNLLVCSDNVENTNILLKNITKQIDEKIVIFDTDGLFDAENKITFGKDFKLPLNYDTINFIYENELDDVDATSRAVIQDIFIEVQEYTKNLPEGYLPFETFINVVDQQYKETQIPQLVLLKNKLIKYRDLNAFAETLKDVLSLSIAIDKSKVTIIDISEMAPVLQKEIMSYTYGVMKGINETIYSFVKVDNANSSKRLLKTFLSRDGIYTTIICRHEYKYLPELKSAAQNLILFTPQTLQHDFAAYNTFLNKLNTDEFIIYGAHTQNIPLIVELDELELDTQNDDDETESEKDIEEIPSSNVVPMPAPVQNTAPQENVTETPEPEIQEEETFKAPDVEYPDLGFDNETPSSNEAPTVDFPEAETLNVTEEQPEENFTQIELPETFEEPEIEEVQQEEPKEDIQENFDNEIAQEPVEEEVFMPETDIPQVEINEDLAEQAIIEDINTPDTPVDYASQEIEEQAPIYNILDDNEIDYQDAEPKVLPLEPEIDYSVEDIDIEENYQEPQPYDENEAMIEQAAKDVDKLIYEKLPNEDVTLDDLSDLQSDELTEDDLNLIGDLASDNGITPEPELEYNEEQPPVVPIYNAEDIEPQEQQSLEPGDRVSSPKYGEGVVEKMIKYGNKMLCSIEFPNIGRRLLDPAMTEIKKLD